MISNKSSTLILPFKDLVTKALTKATYLDRQIAPPDPKGKNKKENISLIYILHIFLKQ